MSVCPTLLILAAGSHISVMVLNVAFWVDMFKISEHLTLVQDENKKARKALTDREMNYTSAEVLKLLRSKKVSYSVIILVPLRGTFPSILSRSLTLI